MNDLCKFQKSYGAFLTHTKKNGELVMPHLQSLIYNIILTLTTEVASTISLVVFGGLLPSLCYCYYFLSLFTAWQIKDDDDDDDDKIAKFLQFYSYV